MHSPRVQTHYEKKSIASKFDYCLAISIHLTLLNKNIILFVMPFCYAPWSNVEIGPLGNILPCCKFRYDRYDNVSPCNINTTSLDEYKNSTLLNSVKEDFEAGRWPVGCDRCRIEEENGIASKRQLDYQRWQDHYDRYNKVGWLTASIAFGNTCNLTCITCSPWASSRWQKEYQQKYKIDTFE